MRARQAKPWVHKPVHDRLFEADHPRELRIDMELEDVPGEPVDERLVRGRGGFYREIGLAFRERNDVRGAFSPPNPPSRRAKTVMTFVKSFLPFE